MAKVIATPINTDSSCYLGCGQIAKFVFKSGKLCCSDHQNKCIAKREHFSRTQDHKANGQKSLATRAALGITKAAQIKGGQTRRESGHYERQAAAMRKHWAERPWNNNPKWANYKDTNLAVQSSYEHKFISDLETRYGIEWVRNNVKRGPAIYYTDPESGKRRMYLPDFSVEEALYEIKGDYTWNLDLERNQAKLDSAVDSGYNMFLVLEGEIIQWK